MFFKANKFLLSTLIVCLMVCLFTPDGSAQQAVKIGFVDLQEVFKSGAKFKQTKNELREVLNEKVSKLQQMKQNFKSERDQFLLQKELLPDDTAQQREQNLKEEYDRILNMEQQEMKDFEGMKEDKIDPLIEEIITVVETIAKEEGYSIILHKTTLLYGDPQFDITAKVIDRINK